METLVSDTILYIFNMIDGQRNCASFAISSRQIYDAVMTYVRRIKLRQRSRIDTASVNEIPTTWGMREIIDYLQRTCWVIRLVPICPLETFVSCRCDICCHSKWHEMSAISGVFKFTLTRPMHAYVDIMDIAYLSICAECITGLKNSHLTYYINYSPHNKQLPLDDIPNPAVGKIRFINYQGGYVEVKRA